jgi:large subunit ribosomal protein L15
VVNLDRSPSIAELGVTEIGLDDYKKLGLASSKKALIKILGSGELKKAITIHAHKFSKSASRRSKRPAARLWFWAARRLRGGVDLVRAGKADREWRT